ncbi:hypothetical protein PAHAL_9G014600 [Panicum hallii]|uniref:Bowman-Birk serine protease inhibitors family domain-containing protein n=1 Tax=Panicum hallii TaxID=206008 RepID=A0A2T8HZR4_9POAL|nr:hypothetical protein PAHAL_9G014600 [Panicum hallii]
MRGRRCRDGGLAYVAAVFLLLASLPESQCRPQLLEAGGRSSSSNDSDVVLVFCQWSKCGSDWSTCYCCLSTEPRACYDTRDECRANCVVCNPRCPSPPSRQPAVEGRRLLGSNNSTSHHN